MVLLLLAVVVVVHVGRGGRAPLLLRRVVRRWGVRIDIIGGHSRERSVFVKEGARGGWKEDGGGYAEGGEEEDGGCLEERPLKRRREDGGFKAREATP